MCYYICLIGFSIQMALGYEQLDLVIIWNGSKHFNVIINY